ncbi:MAG TPA: four helix bundle protein [Candidatus Acidoferrum sp.]|jgi:four helix bundle protein|nr:four helix bundle protein [Candidatus Acidoferrum sp.]
MKYERFEDLPVWQAASGLAVRVFAMGEKTPLRRHRSLRDQIERAALSVSNNIGEGFERGTTNELLSFLYIARGSAGEVRSMLCVMDRMSAFSDLKSEISDLKSLAESISRQLRGWAQHLQDTPIRGQRHVTSQSRQIDQARRDRDAFLKELEEIRSKPH